MANQDAGKAYKPFGDAAILHYIADNQEKGNGQKRIAVKHGENILYNGNGCNPHQGSRNKAGNTQANGDRHTEESQYYKGAKEKNNHTACCHINPPHYPQLPCSAHVFC